MKLAQLQAALQSHLLRGDERIAEQVVGDACNPVAARLEVYTGAYASRLIDVLGETFPAVRMALGPEGFAQRVGPFVREHPSRFFSARDYGEALAAWLAAHLDGGRACGVADLARFEWAVAAAFDAADAVALPPVTVAGIAPGQWPRLQLGFSPALRRLQVGSNALAWWKFACAAQPRPSRWRSSRTQEWLVWRKDLAVLFRRLGPTEAQALDSARRGSCFGELCERLSAAQAARLLHGWFSAGLIVAATVGTAG